jgi:hypothetical protein
LAVFEFAVPSDDAISSAARVPPRDDHPADTALRRREQAGFGELFTRGFRAYFMVNIPLAPGTMKKSV